MLINHLISGMKNDPSPSRRNVPREIRGQQKGKYGSFHGTVSPEVAENGLIGMQRSGCAKNGIKNCGNGPERGRFVRDIQQ